MQLRLPDPQRLVNPFSAAARRGKSCRSLIKKKSKKKNSNRVYFVFAQLGPHRPAVNPRYVNGDAAL